MRCCRPFPEQLSIQSHYLQVSPLSVSLPCMNVGGEFPIVWRASDAQLHPNCTEPCDDFVYIVGRSKGEDGELAVSNWSENMIRLKGTDEIMGERNGIENSLGSRFSHECGRKPDKILDASLVDTSSAWIYPVEPPKNRVQYANMTAKVRRWFHHRCTKWLDNPMERKRADVQTIVVDSQFLSVRGHLCDGNQVESISVNQQDKKRS